MTEMTTPVWVRRPSEEEIATMKEWPIWEHDVEVWPVERADNYETFLVIEGRAYVEMENGDLYRFTKGDMVTQAPGIKCNWGVEEPIKKHYNFDTEFKGK